MTPDAQGTATQIADRSVGVIEELAEATLTASAGSLGSASTPPPAPTPRGRSAKARWTGRIVNTLLGLAAFVLFTVVAAPRVLHVDLLPVLSGSMAPKLPIGALVVDRPVAASELRVGDIITFHPPTRPDEVITHRIYRVVTSHSRRAFLTKGDANGAPDPWIIPAQGTGYRYWFSVKHLGFLVVDVRTPVSRLALLSAIALLLVVWILADVWKRPAGEPVHATPA